MARSFSLHLVGLLCCSALLQGCLFWPRAGGGGLAEKHVHISPSVREYSWQISELTDRGARRRQPAAFKETDDLLVRAHRAQTAGLHEDADEDFHRLRRLLANVRRRENR